VIVVGELAVGVEDVASTVELHAGWLAHVTPRSAHELGSGLTVVPPLPGEFR
jgi:hypothetical protein